MLQENVTTDPVEAAEQAGLRYVTDTRPGIRREREGDTFRYLRSDGTPITEPRELERITSLGIPPAWTDVWISPLARGHLQATGRDVRGRKQYRYHPRWRAARDETKYYRMIQFGEALPAIRAQVLHDLGLPGLTRPKVLATVVQLLDETAIRVGNEEYARENQSYGLTTLKQQHVDVEGATLHFHFKGKSGKDHRIDVRDRRVARIVRRCQDLDGQELFQYVDAQGERHNIESSDVNAYLREMTGQEFTAKDFRTWHGTVTATRALKAYGAADTVTQARHVVVQAIKEAAAYLGNTPAICRKSYVYPGVIDAYLNNELLGLLGERTVAPLDGLRDDEAEVLALLRTLSERDHVGRGAA